MSAAEEESLSLHLAAPPARVQAARDSATRLRGNIGLIQLVFTVLSYNAPLGILAGVLPLVIGFGIGIGAPLLFIALGLLMALFAVGYTAMSRKLENPGAFYAYVTAGLGKPLGLGASFVAMVSYSIAMAGALVFTSMAIESFVRTTLHGANISWWIWALIFAAAIGILGYLKVDISARVLGVLMSLEILIVLVWDAVVIGRGGATGTLTFSSFNPSVALGGSLAVGLIFAISCFSGFEATAIFRDEVRNPVKTVPRATFLSIGIITVFYALAAWVIVQAFGQDKAIAAIAGDPTGAFFTSVTQYIGRAGYDITTALLITSAFAALVAYHNVVSRYLFNLGADGVLPKQIGASHTRFGSPHRASVILTGATFLFIAVTALSRQAPDKIYTILIGISGYSFIMLLVLAAIGIATYLIRSRIPEFTLWSRVIAPIATAVLFVAVGVLCTLKINTLTGSSGISIAAAVITFGAIALGVIVTLIYRARRPEVFARIGRQ